MRLLWKAACGALAFASVALAQAQNIADQDRGPGVLAGPAKVSAGVREYQWTVRMPVLTVEHRRIVTRVYAPIMRARRLDYAVPDFRDKRTKLGRVAEFSCKYPDVRLPNECRTVWHDLYADVPVIVMRHDYLDVDVAQWEWQDRSIIIDVPHLTWTEQTLTVSVPALVQSEAAARAQATLVANQSAMKMIDDAIAALQASIEVAKSQGADPARLAASDGATIDLYAILDALLNEKM